MRRFVLLAALLLMPFARAQDNFLVLVADDVGVDRIGAYGEHPDPGQTPNVDQLASQGVLFRNAWALPSCSPSRACALTGRYAFRTGIGHITTSGQLGLDPAEWILPEMLTCAPAGAYRSAALGKWHLYGAWGSVHPLLCGFDRHAGSIGKLTSYFEWTKSHNGRLGTSKQYATTDTADDALRAIEALPEPWIVWVAFNAAHKPLHAPPSHLHSYSLSGDPSETPVEHVKAMVEAMDTEIGRLLASIQPQVLDRTTVVFFGDNGTTNEATSPPFIPGHAKGTLFEGGVNVPLIISGPQVSHPGSECAALVNLTDLYATLAEIADVDLGTAGIDLDSVSLLPYLQDPTTPSIREWVFAESFDPNGPGPYKHHHRAIRGQRFKLIRKSYYSSIVQELLYDLEQDPFEETNLLLQDLTREQRRAYHRLRRQMRRLVGS